MVSGEELKMWLKKKQTLWRRSSLGFRIKGNRLSVRAVYSYSMCLVQFKAQSGGDYQNREGLFFASQPQRRANHEVHQDISIILHNRVNYQIKLAPASILQLNRIHMGRESCYDKHMQVSTLEMSQWIASNLPVSFNYLKNSFAQINIEDQRMVTEHLIGSSKFLNLLSEYTQGLRMLLEKWKESRFHRNKNQLSEAGDAAQRCSAGKKDCCLMTLAHSIPTRTLARLIDISPMACKVTLSLLDCRLSFYFFHLTNHTCCSHAILQVPN